MKKINLAFITVLLIIGSACLCLAGEQSETEYEAPNCKGFKTIKSFGELKVSFRGSVENIGLDKTELTDHLRSAFKNSFGEVAFQKEDNLYLTSRDKEIAPTIGFIAVEVWTVGENYPVAYHITLFAGNLTDVNEYSKGNLGYDSKENLPAIAKDTISAFIEELATAFSKAREEL